MEQITGTEYLSLLRPIRNASHMSEKHFPRWGQQWSCVVQLLGFLECFLTQHRASISYIAIPEAATMLKRMKKLVPFLLITRNHEKKNICNSRESNPGLIRGRDLSYHLTTIAPLPIPFIAYSPITIHFTHFHELCKPKTTLYRQFTAFFGNSHPWNVWIAVTLNCSVCYIAFRHQDSIQVWMNAILSVIAVVALLIFAFLCTD